MASESPSFAGSYVDLSDGFNAPHVAGDERPYSLSSRELTDLERKVVEKKTRQRAVLNDVLKSISGETVKCQNQPVSISGEVMWTFKGDGSDFVYQPIVEPASGSPINTFTTRPEGYERDVTMKRLKMTYAEYSYGLAKFQKGIKYNQLSVFDWYSKHSSYVGQYFDELGGQYKREALLETYCERLTESPRNLTQAWNPNNYVIGATAQPAYDRTLADHTANIADALEEATDGNTNGSSAWATLNEIIALEEYISVDLKIQPLPNGKWILLIPSKQYRLLAKTNSGQVGEGYRQNDVGEFTYPGVVTTIGNFMVVPDSRYPTVTFDTYGGTATTEYTKPGNDDSRNRAVYNSTSNISWDIGFVLGEGALWRLVENDIYYAENEQGYKREKGTMAFVEDGYGLTFWDVDTDSQATTTASRYNDRSCAVWFAATTLAS